MWLVNSVSSSVTSFFTNYITGERTETDRLYRFENLYNDTLQIISEVQQYNENNRKDWITQTNVKQDLEQMVDLLIEEEKSIQKEGRGEAQGGEVLGLCVEFLINKRVIDTLCGIALSDNPEGAAELIICHLAKVFGSLSTNLLSINTIYMSVSALIEKYVQSFSQISDPKLKSAVTSLSEV